MMYDTEEDKKPTEYTPFPQQGVATWDLRAGCSRFLQAYVLLCPLRFAFDTTLENRERCGKIIDQTTNESAND